MEADRNTSGAAHFELVNSDDLALIKQVLEHQGGSPMEAEAAEKLLEAGSGLPFPPNLFVVGTVNVDETTYMFSPKVLDRAFVMELNSVRPAAYFSKAAAAHGATIAGYEAQQLFEKSMERRVGGRSRHDKPADMLEEAAVAAGLDLSSSSEIKEAVEATLNGAYVLLNPVGFAFGYRVVDELVQYLSVWLEAQSMRARSGLIRPHWRTALDCAVLMKVLPKIHGNRRQLGDSLQALAAFLAGKAAPDASYAMGSAPPVGIGEEEKLDFSLRSSRKKTEKLDRGLRATGYATFIS